MYYTQDANMNITALVAVDGDVVERYVYDTYGRMGIYDGAWTSELSWSGSKKNEILYCGYRFDPESGLYRALRGILLGGIPRVPASQPQRTAYVPAIRKEIGWPRRTNLFPMSGRRDLNPRPLDPQSSTLSKLRHAPRYFAAPL